MRVAGVGVGERVGVGGVAARKGGDRVGVLELLSKGKEPREETVSAKEVAASRGGDGGDGGGSGVGDGGLEVPGVVASAS